MTINTRPGERVALGQFRSLVMADTALQHTLVQAETGDRFVALALHIAGRNEILLAADDLWPALQPDPLGLARWTAAPANGVFWPPPPWLPIHVSTGNGRLWIDWAHFGSTPLTAPFFEDSIRRAMARPFNQLFHYRMTLDDFLAGGADEQVLPPSGFIFHMSRCGSTLVSQMLTAPPANQVVSEAAPIDAVIQLLHKLTDLPAEQQRAAMRAIVAAFGRRRSDAARHYVFKFDCWHALALPLLRRAFPTVPWVFLYRDPVEVLVSQRRQPGSQMVPDIVSPSFYGIDGYDGVDEYHARVLAKICDAAVVGLRTGGGLPINYRALPESVFTKILPHFGIGCSAPERQNMAQATRNDVKSPGSAFAGDSAIKQQEASARVRALAQRHLSDVYRRLEALTISG